MHTLWLALQAVLILALVVGGLWWLGVRSESKTPGKGGWEDR